MKGFNKAIHRIERQRQKLEKDYKKKLKKLRDKETKLHRKFHSR